MSSRRLRSHSKSSPPPSAILPDELIIEILSRLPVKSLIKMKSICKKWKTLFIKIHLNHSSSSQNPCSYLYYFNISPQIGKYIFIPFPVNHLLENHNITLPKDPYYQLNDDKYCCVVVGSCNGLVCLRSYTFDDEIKTVMWLRFWNPATRTISDKLGFLYDSDHIWCVCDFVFGYDNSTNTYKVVALHYDGIDGEVKVFSFGDNVWRNIQNLPFAARRLTTVSMDSRIYGGVHFNSTVNWVTTVSNDNVYQVVIFSLDLGTETYTQLLPPPGYENVARVIPNVCVLTNLFCFYHDYEGTDFVIWKMEEFGNEKSWSQIFKFSYQTLGMNYKFELGRLRLTLKPLHLSENHDTVVLANNLENRAILYNRRTNRAKKTRITKKMHWFSMNDYVESLVSTS
jgi:F-box interacting protein